MTGLWVALLGVLLLATVRAVDPLSVWIGTPDRRLGFLAWITFPALFLAGYACDRACCDPPRAARLDARRRRARRLEHGRVARAFAARSRSFADSRAGGPFGQPAYLGAACLLLGPLSVATALDAGECKWWRRAGALGGGAALVALAASQTRAAWVGAIVAAVVDRGRAAASVAPIPGVGSGGRRGGCDRNRRRDHHAARRPGYLVVRSAQGTSASRFDEWRTAIATIADYPVLGVGPEGYRVVFPQEVSESYIQKYGVAVFPDRAHDGILDVTLAGGVLAGLLYAALLTLAVAHAWRGIAFT